MNKPLLCTHIACEIRSALQKTAAHIIPGGVNSNTLYATAQLAVEIDGEPYRIVVAHHSAPVSIGTEPVAEHFSRPLPARSERSMVSDGGEAIALKGNPETMAAAMALRGE